MQKKIPKNIAYLLSADNLFAAKMCKKLFNTLAFFRINIRLHDDGVKFHIKNISYSFDVPNAEYLLDTIFGISGNDIRVCARLFKMFQTMLSGRGKKISNTFRKKMARSIS